VREDVNPILRGGGSASGRGIGHRRSNLTVNIIFYLCKINIFLLFILESFYFTMFDLKMIIRKKIFFSLFGNFIYTNFSDLFLKNV